MNIKKILFASVFVLPVIAQAEAVDNTLDSLHFRPAQATIVGRLEFTPDVFYRSYAPAGDPNTFGTHARYPVNAGVAYGVTDLLSVGITEGYLFHSTYQTDRPNGRQTNGSAGGFSDPTLNANYRYIGGLSGTFFADAYVNVSPSIGEARTTGYPDAGNDLRGASTYEIGTTAYAVSGNQEASLGINGTFETGVDSTGGTGASTTTHDSFFSFALAGEYRYHWTPSFYTQLGATFNLVHTVDQTYPDLTPLRTDTVHYPCYLVPSLELGYLITPKWLFTTGIDYLEYTSSDTDTHFGVSTTNTEIKEIAFNAGIRFIL